MKASLQDEHHERDENHCSVWGESVDIPAESDATFWPIREELSRLASRRGTHQRFNPKMKYAKKVVDPTKHGLKFNFRVVNLFDRCLKR